jgi:hypothetical protein
MEYAPQHKRGNDQEHNAKRPEQHQFGEIVR